MRSATRALCGVCAVLLVGGLVLVVAACGGGEGEGTVTLTEDASGQTVDVGVGEEIVVKLPSNPTTGYSWQVGSGLDTAVVEKVSDEYAADEQTENRAGAGGTETWVFRAVGAGTTEVALDYLRTFEEGSTTETFSVTVDVEG